MNDASLLQRLVELPESRLRRIDARVKLSLAALFVGALAGVPSGALWPFARLGGLLVLLALAGGVPLRAWLIRLLPLAPFLLSTLFLLFVRPEPGGLGHPPPWPAEPLEGVARAAGVGARMLTIGGVMALLAASTPFDEILRALRAFRVPAAVVQSLELLFRYLFLLLDEGARMRRAYASRGGVWRPGALARQSLGALVGMLFVRSYGRGERVHRAMQARGYEEHVRPPIDPWPAPAQLAGAAALGLLIAALRWGVRHG
jgi:cobalt/nickel transport system permease protein